MQRPTKDGLHGDLFCRRVEVARCSLCWSEWVNGGAVDPVNATLVNVWTERITAIGARRSSCIMTVMHEMPRFDRLSCSALVAPRACRQRGGASQSPALCVMSMRPATGGGRIR